MWSSLVCAANIVWFFRTVNLFAQTMNAILDTVDSHAYDLDEEGEGVENPVEDSVGADLRA